MRYFLGRFFSLLFVSTFTLALPLQVQAEQLLLPELEGLSKEQQNRAIDLIKGVATNVLLHEAGHMLIFELSLPVIGREEEEVDTFATITMLNRRDKLFDKALMDSTTLWLLSSEAARAAGVDAPFWDEHTADEDRGYSTVCLMFGRDPEEFKAFADSIGLPEGRRENCSYEYETAVNGWDTILKNYEIRDGPHAKFEEVYEPAVSEDLRPYAEFLKDSDLLSVLQTTIAQKYKLLPGIKLRSASCGESNAFWISEKREILFCHEFIRFHASLLSTDLSRRSEQDIGTSGNVILRK